MITGKNAEFCFDRHVAYSEASTHSPKQYVQDLLKRDAEKIYQQWIREGGNIYVCGKIQMATGVQETLLQILQNIGNMYRCTAEKFFSDLKNSGKYKQDIFG